MVMKMLFLERKEIAAKLIYSRANYIFCSSRCNFNLELKNVDADAPSTVRMIYDTRNKRIQAIYRSVFIPHDLPNDRPREKEILLRSP